MLSYQLLKCLYFKLIIIFLWIVIAFDLYISIDSFQAFIQDTEVNLDSLSLSLSLTLSLLFSPSLSLTLFHSLLLSLFLPLILSLSVSLPLSHFTNTATLLVALFAPLSSFLLISCIIISGGQ